MTRRGHATLHVTAFKADGCKSSRNLFGSFDGRDFFHRRVKGVGQVRRGKRPAVTPSVNLDSLKNVAQRECGKEIEI